jgi:hypothetical protein
MRHRTKLLLLFYLCAPAFAQQNTVSPLPFDPATAYEQASRPFDTIRRAPQNWSEIELAALKTMTDQAKADCSAHSAKEFSSTTLLAYARLCSLGRDWKPVQEASAKFITAASSPTQVADASNTRDLAMAYDYNVQANIRLENAEQAFHTATEMLHSVPYDDLASEATTSIIRYTFLQHTDRMLALLAQRQPLLLALMHSHDSEDHKPSGPGLSIHDLYAQAIALPTMQQLNNRVSEAAAAYAELEASLPKSLSADDQSSNAATRRQYLLLGTHIPKIDTFAWLPDLAAAGLPPAINDDKSAAKVLLLFPGWCNQCIALHTDFWPTSRRLLQQDVRFFALMAQDEPPKTAPKDVTKARTGHTNETASAAKLKPFPGEDPNIPHVELQLQSKPTATALLSGTPTFVVPTHTLDDFAATNFPLVVVVDHRGTIRAIQPTDENPLAPDGLIDQLAAHVITLWPPTQ